MNSSKIIYYTKTDEAPALATNSFLPILDSSADKNCFSSNSSDSNFVDLISSDSECKSLITFWNIIFYKQALSLNSFTFLNLPGVGVSWNVFTGAGSWRCSVALLSIFYQERARKHFSIRDEAPLEPELASVNTIYSRDPEYILALLHTSSPIKTLPSKTKCW